jgi:hypothetical protein
MAAKTQNLVTAKIQNHDTVKIVKDRLAKKKSEQADNNLNTTDLELKESK